MRHNRTTPIASWLMIVAAILLGIGTSVSAMSLRPGQQPPSPEQTEAGDNCGPVINIGGSVRPPIATHTPDPKFTKAARDAKFSGNVIVGLIVDRDGKPCNVHLVRGVGIMGLDESAVDSVQHYRFKPATQNGKPVAVRLNIEVNFQAF